MKYSFAALAMAATGALAYSNGTVYTTEVVTALTTYCPAATTLTHGSMTYTVTEATTLTITDCPCTVTKPMMTSTASASTVLYTSCPSSEASSSATMKVIPPKSSGTYTNPLTVVYSTPGSGASKTMGGASGTGVMPTSPAFTGGASANKVGAFVGAVAGLAALAL